MVVNVGSMFVAAKFNASAITTGLSKVKSRFKNITLSSKFLNSQLGRLKNTLNAVKNISLVAGGGLLAGITAAIMKSPLLAGELEKLKIEFMLLGNILAKYIKPILQWFVKILRWVRLKFLDLPKPMQDVIAKVILLGAVLLTVIIAGALLVLGLGAVTSALTVLFPAGVMATLVAFKASIISIIAGSLILAGALGILLGLFGVFALDKLGILDMISDVGEGFRNWDSIIRDVIVTFSALWGLVGGLAIDISRGDFDFSTTKDWYGKWKESAGRATSYVMGDYEYGQGSKVESGWEGPTLEEYGKSDTNIGKQENSIVINANSLEGSLEDPEVMKELADLLGEQLALNQQRESI